MPDEQEKKAPAPKPVWLPWPIPEHRRQGGGGGWCVTLGEPNERVAVGRQVGGVPTLTRPEAEAIAEALNKIGAE